MGNFIWRSEDYNASRNVDSAHEVSEGNEDSIRYWTGGHFCYILAENMSILYPCPETSCEAEFKGDELKILV